MRINNLSKVWMTSDTHYSHKNTLRYCGRPFFTIEECDEAMIERWNSKVKPEDTVYHIGDVAMHTAPIKRILPRLNGKKILIVGNHDLIYPYFIKTRGQKFVDRMTEEYIEAGFEQILPSGTEIDFPLDAASFIEYHQLGLPAKIRLCHFPTKNAQDNHGLKHMEARPYDTGILNICGHVHQNWLKRGNNINVGVDVMEFSPVNLDDIIQLWLTGADNIDNPNRIRCGIWKLYHTAIWRWNKVKDWLLKDKKLSKVK